MIHNIGDKVFCRSNEPEQPLIVGHIKRIETCGGKCHLPVVEDELGKEWMGGCIRPYDNAVHLVIIGLPSIEQWNYLVQDVPHNQIPEKYGVKYKTFNK